MSKIVTLFLLLFSSISVFALDEPNKFIYKFENPRFDVSFVEIDIQFNGEGRLRYKKRDENDEVKESLKLLPSTVRRLQGLFNDLKFLESTDSYQSDKSLPHLGTVTLVMKANGREREINFNYTSNRSLMQIVELFRGIENQQRRLTELKFARQYSHLDLPKQLKNLEGELKRDKIAEPEQVLPILSEIALDDSLPLIARNSAEKLIKQIKK
ncbi:MAG: hypothetical protein JNN15_02010 [Blastocatellia bacterium]|nr:hypothetical protein [Blastocatellia bacterium]